MYEITHMHAPHTHTHARTLATLNLLYFWTPCENGAGLSSLQQRGPEVKDPSPPSSTQVNTPSVIFLHLNFILPFPSPHPRTQAKIIPSLPAKGDGQPYILSGQVPSPGKPRLPPQVCPPQGRRTESLLAGRAWSLPHAPQYLG